MVNNTIIECKTCKHNKKGYCKLKDMKISINASWCNKYKKSFLTLIIELFNKLKTFYESFGNSNK